MSQVRVLSPVPTFSTGVAQLARALVLGTSSRRFESCRLYFLSIYSQLSDSMATCTPEHVPDHDFKPFLWLRCWSSPPVEKPIREFDPRQPRIISYLYCFTWLSSWRNGERSGLLSRGLWVRVPPETHSDLQKTALMTHRNALCRPAQQSKIQYNTHDSDFIPKHDNHTYKYLSSFSAVAPNRSGGFLLSTLPR